MFPYKFSNTFRTMARVARGNIKAPKNKASSVQPLDKISSRKREIVIGRDKRADSHHLPKTLDTFSTLQLRQDVVHALENANIMHPTVIQRLAIPLVNKKKNVFCAAQTGSGKTIVYASPIVSKLKDETDEGFINRLSRPRALIVAPSRELAQQILKIFKNISHNAPIRSLGLIGQNQKKWTREYLKGIVDVVIGTPNTILKHHQKGNLHFSDLRFLVLDEADTLWDENFREITMDIFNACGVYESMDVYTSRNVQCILAAATLPPKGILSGYKRYFQDLEVCQSNLHKVLPNIKHSFVKTNQQEKIDLTLVKLMKLLKKSSSRQCVVFCNTSKSCNFVSAKMAENDIEHSKLHGNMNPQVRLNDFERFVNKDTRILVCTDVASRGLDTSEVVLVLNFDCPFNTTDYLHRAGRTGRAREVYVGEGEVVTYITQNKEVLFARKIQEAAKKNAILDDVKSKRNSSKTKYNNEMMSVIKRMERK